MSRDERGHALLRPMGFEPSQGIRSVRRLASLLGGAAALLWQASPPLVLGFAALHVVSAIVAGASLLAIRSLVASLASANSPHAGLMSIAPPLVALAGIVALLGLAAAVRRGVTLLLEERVGAIAWERILEVAGRVELAAFDDPGFHDRLQRAQTGGQRPVQVTQSLVGMSSSITTAAGVVAVLFVLQPLLVPTLLLASVPLVIATSAFSRDFHRFTIRFAHQDRRRWYVRSLLTDRKMAKEIRAFGLAEYMRALHRRFHDEQMEDLARLVRRGYLRALAATLGAVAAMAATVAALVWFVSSGRTSIATATAAAVAIVQLGMVLNGLAAAAGQLYEGALFLDDHRTFCDMLPPAGPRRRGRGAPAGFEAIHVEGVGFSYPDAARPALQDVSLTIRRGETVALVGENGSGKTTLAKLLCQLYRPQTGRIRWDGVDLAEVDPAELRDSIAVVFQDYAQYLFDAASNVGMGRVERWDDRPGIERAARQAGAHEFLSQLPQGYDTMLSTIFDSGVDLSLGEWQRLALARAFFRDAPFVILDEPTAALDARWEYELFSSIRALLRDRTVLLISHRFSTVVSADRIYVLSGGRLTEQGSHRELMQLGGRYAELFTMQASVYVEGAESVNARA